MRKSFCSGVLARQAGGQRGQVRQSRSRRATTVVLAQLPDLQGVLTRVTTSAQPRPARFAKKPQVPQGDFFQGVFSGWAGKQAHFSQKTSGFLRVAGNPGDVF